jgi:hypothetical protein
MCPSETWLDNSSLKGFQLENIAVNSYISQSPFKPGRTPFSIDPEKIYQLELH